MSHLVSSIINGSIFSEAAVNPPSKVQGKSAAGWLSRRAVVDQSVAGR